MDLGGFLGTIIIGGLAGWVGSMIMKTNASMGMIANIVVGIVGAFIGNFLLVMFFDDAGTTGFTLQSFFVALLGAVILLFVVKLFRGRGNTTVA
ncbi:GlsB/YeaQ/YmgE family stress response membrane protein [Pedobacter sp.]|nr:GlsB/YeaQ/YmgE family stress response membrane protein [Candidatus Saccharibacteria bacterium]